jgi:hypothetical protein
MRSHVIRMREGNDSLLAGHENPVFTDMLENSVLDDYNS